MAVALPDICVSLMSSNGETNGNLYKKWCNENLGPEFSYVKGEDLWSMRCGVLHNGRFGDMKHSVSRVIFVLPGNVNMANNIIEDAYVYSVVSFCQNFTDAVHEWFEQNRENETVKANLPRLMQYRVGGLSPYIKGPTVLA